MVKCTFFAPCKPHSLGFKQNLTTGDLQPECRLPQTSPILWVLLCVPHTNTPHLQLRSFHSRLQQLGPAERVGPKQNRAENHIFTGCQISSPTLNERYYFWEKNVTHYHQNSASLAKLPTVSLHGWHLSTQGQCKEIHQAQYKSRKHKFLCD